MNTRTSYREYLERQLAENPEFRKEWERTAASRAVALWLVGLRADRGWTQRDLAERIGVRQEAVARWETGDAEPRLSTLLGISRTLALPLHIDLRPDTTDSTEAVSVSAECAAA